MYFGPHEEGFRGARLLEHATNDITRDLPQEVRVLLT
jgi:hypothetical protein